MKLKHEGQHVFRTGQRIAQHFKPTEKEKEDEVNARERKELTEFAQSAMERFNDQKREERLRDRPDPPPILQTSEGPRVLFLFFLALRSLRSLRTVAWAFSEELRFNLEFLFRCCLMFFLESDLKPFFGYGKKRSLHAAPL